MSLCFGRRSGIILCCDMGLMESGEARILGGKFNKWRRVKWEGRKIIREKIPKGKH